MVKAIGLLTHYQNHAKSYKTGWQNSVLLIALFCTFILQNTVIDGNSVNEVLSELVLFYVIGKERLIFVNRDDAKNKKTFQAKTFYVYEVNINSLLKFDLSEE